MAEQGAVINTTEEKTDGKSFGPVTDNQKLVGYAATIVAFALSFLGVPVPPGLDVAIAVFLLIFVGWVTKGRKVVETKTVFEQPSIGIPVGQESTPAYDQGVTPSIGDIPDGNGAHRADPTDYSGE